MLIDVILPFLVTFFLFFSFLFYVIFQSLSSIHDWMGIHDYKGRKKKQRSARVRSPSRIRTSVWHTTSSTSFTRSGLDFFHGAFPPPRSARPRAPLIAASRARPILSDPVDYVIQVNASACHGLSRSQQRGLPPYKQVSLPSKSNG